MEKTKELLFNHKAWANARPKTISRRAFARELGTTDSNLISIEKGKTLPSITLAFKYCNATHLPLNDLCLRK